MSRPDAGPALLVTTDEPLSAEEVDLLSRQLAEAIALRNTLIVMPSGVEIYQLVDGRWQPLHQGRLKTVPALDIKTGG